MMAEEWFENHGTLPGGLSGKRVYVELRNGIRPAESWPADAAYKGYKTDWELTGSGGDILRWRPA